MRWMYTWMIFMISLGSISGQQKEDKISTLDTYIENARIQWQVPGLSVGIVKDGKVLMSKGYGERKIDTGVAVDGETIFSIGSTTKAMTAAAIAILVDEGKVRWDDRVIEHLPEFRLFDPYVTREIKIRDLLTHKAGLGNADLLWVLKDYSTEEILRRIEFKEPGYSFRGGYTYQNIMYATAGILIERLSGMAWSEFIRTRLFDPLGMTHSRALKSEALEVENRSVPHYFYNDQVTPITDSNADSIGAAGSIWSCTDDMVKWMNFVLDSARVNGKRLISAASFEELHRPHIVIPQKNFYPTVQLTHPHFTTYALGWFQEDYRGEFVHFHTGSLNGTVAIIGLLPERDLGVYVFGNLDHAEVRHAIMYRVFDTFLNLEETDWSTEFLHLYENRKKTREQRLSKRISDRIPETTSTLPLDKYTGTYSNEFLGDIVISLNDEHLQIWFRDDRNMNLEHWHYDTFLGKIIEYPFDRGNLVDFNFDENQKAKINIYGYEFIRK